MIVTDTVFSMDGDRANIDDLQKIENFSNAILMQDDAHGFGIFEPNIPTNSIYMATLGKAAGTMGAFVAGNEDFIQLNRSENDKSRWVELPDCSGASGEIKLEEDLAFGHSPLNASSATCKVRPAL